MAQYVPASIPYDEDNPVEEVMDIIYDITFPASMSYKPFEVDLEANGEDEIFDIDNVPKVLPPTPIPSPPPEDDNLELDEGGNEGTPPFSQLNRSSSPQGSTNLNPANFGNSPPVPFSH
jgi:hypothetical protein